MRLGRRRAARLAEAETRRTEAAVAAERQRIAREMHDIVAHSLSVIVVQADGGRYAAAHDPEAAARVLASIAETGRTALADTRRILGLLRDGADAADRSPLPATHTVADLVDAMRASGFDVVHVVTGSPRPLPPGLRLTVYRVCQESLTNVLKHAGPAAQVVVTESYRPRGLRLTVRNTPGAALAEAGPADGAAPPGAAAGSGHGLSGWRVRAVLGGGAVAAGPCSDGGFRVRLDLPYPEAGGWKADPPPRPAPPEESDTAL
ncbi:MAG: histidine kinase [Propionibacteriaceae bacterium]|nr:histidine kinase [Propionibacteriaceae bacterium]